MIERKTVRKWIWVWDFEKGEQWLNMMAQSGWALEGVGLCTFRFAACEPGEYIVRLEMRRHDDAYIRFMKETGAEYIGRMMPWMFFRKKAALGEFDIFSDADSRIAHLDTIGKCLGIIGGLNMAIGLRNSFNEPHVGFINLLLAALLMYGLGRIHGKKEELEAKRLLME